MNRKTAKKKRLQEAKKVQLHLIDTKDDPNWLEKALDEALERKLKAEKK